MSTAVSAERRAATGGLCPAFAATRAGLGLVALLFVLAGLG
jgi:hypothetical protein